MSASSALGTSDFNIPVGGVDIDPKTVDTIPSAILDGLYPVAVGHITK